MLWVRVRFSVARHQHHLFFPPHPLCSGPTSALNKRFKKNVSGAYFLTRHLMVKWFPFVRDPPRCLRAIFPSTHPIPTPPTAPTRSTVPLFTLLHEFEFLLVFTVVKWLRWTNGDGGTPKMGYGVCSYIEL